MAHLLALIIRILTPLTFFRTQVVGIVNKLLAQNEEYHNLLGRLLQSGRRDNILAGLDLVASAVHVDSPEPSNLMGGNRGRLAGKVWASVVEGGSAKALGKMLSMRRRTKEGAVDYGDKDPLDRPDIRHLVIHFILPMLPTTAFHAHAKAILPSLYSGLSQDPPITVYRILMAIWAAVSGPPPGVARRISLVLLDEKALIEMSHLLERAGVDPTTGRSVSEIAEGFLEGVTATPHRGICFEDEGWYPLEENDEEKGGRRDRKGLHNRILSNVVKRLGARVIDDEGRVGNWVLRMFDQSPELVAGYWPHSALSLEPRLDARWVATMAFMGRVISLPIPARSKFNQRAPRGTDGTNMPPRSSPPAVDVIVESVLPSPMTKGHMSKGLQHANYLVQHVTALALARGLQKLSAVQALFAQIAAELDEGTDGPWSLRSRELEAECRRRVPEVPVIVAFAQKSATMARPLSDDEDEEVEPALAARSAMLTEAALRLFGLYHKALPSLAGEARFDVGKLLVSASSANAERRARREAREGSVVSDSGSVGSVGTVGTVGMGGGFGHTRGNVEGFEALSQLHVLRLLAEVRGWTWTNKASGSQFTYLYHILQLHLSTRNAVTQAMTTTLLHKLLLPSLLFEHDPLELPIWLDALPYASDSASGPMFMAQQIHLLSFLDECVRRTLKTPHRYIEECAAVVPELSLRDVSSPLLMTMVEQLHAKLIGMHIATEAAAVVLNYLRRVIIGLLVKQAADSFIRVIIKLIANAVQAARDAGQPRGGLAEIIDLIESDLKIINGAGDWPRPDPETPRLIDEAEWEHRSFTRQALKALSGTGTETESLRKMIEGAEDDENSRQAQFLVHFLGADRDQAPIIGLLAACLGRAKENATGHRSKAAVFNDSRVRSIYLTASGTAVRDDLVVLAATLRPQVPFDRALAEHYTHEAIELLRTKEADAIVYAVINPWIRFLSPSQVATALELAVKRLFRKSKRRKSVAPNEDITSALGGLVEMATPSVVFPHLSALLALGIYRPVINCLRSAVARSLSSRLDVDVEKDTLVDIVTGDRDAQALLALLVSFSPKVARAFADALSEHSEWLDDARLLPALAALDTLPAKASTMAVAALRDPTHIDAVYDAAATLLSRASADDVNAAFSGSSECGLPLARAALALVTRAECSTAVQAILSAGLKATTHILSSSSPLAGDEIELLDTLGQVVVQGQAIHVEPSAELAEPVITAAVTDRSDVPSALNFAALLSSRAMLKASFVRQQLQALVVSRSMGRLTLASADKDLRTSFIKLIHALFIANTYVSAQPNFVEPLLPLYRGTLGTADMLLLHVFSAFEAQRKLSSTSILRHWHAGGGVSQKALDALLSLDPTKVFATCSAFPLRRKFEPSIFTASNDDIYDPVFVLSLLSATLGEDLGGLDWVEILRSNVLGLAVCALGSRDAAMRTVASYCLSTTVQLIPRAQFHEGPQLQHTLELVAHALPPKDLGNPSRLPPLIALFVAHALSALANPSSFIYPLSSRFLLQRPTLDASDVPLLYGMLYSSSDASRRERMWILRLLRDGTRSAADVQILARRNTLSLLSSLFQASIDVPFRALILEVFRSVALLPDGAKLVVKYAPWFTGLWSACSQQEQDTILSIMEEAVASGSKHGVAGLVQVASYGADIARARVLSRIALRVGEVSLIPSLLVDDAEVTELLFRLSLRIATMTPELKKAVETLAPRVAALSGPIGEWARSEARKCE